MSSVYTDHQPKDSGGGLYLRLKDGETGRLRIASEPVIYDSEYKEKISTKYAWVVWNIELKTAQVFQQSATFFKNLANYAKDSEYGDPTEYDIKVTREGSDTDTIYHITPGRNSYKLDDDALEAVKKIDLVDAVSKGQGVSNVYWLGDFISAEEQSQDTTSGYDKAKATAKSLKKDDVKEEDDTVIEDISEEPINLDDIPF